MMLELLADFAAFVRMMLVPGAFQAALSQALDLDAWNNTEN